MIENLLRKDTNNLTAWVEFKHGIFLQFQYIARAALKAISDDCLFWKYDDKLKTRVQQIDGERLTEAYTKAAVRDWKGVTPNSLAKLIPVDLNSVPEDKREEAIPFTQAELLILVKNAYDLDRFIQDVAPDISYFRPNQESDLKNSAASQSGS